MQASSEQFLHDFIIGEVKKRYSVAYKEIHINPGEEKNFEVKGQYPDVVFGGYGQITRLVEVETEGSIKEESVQRWKEMAGLGIQLTILVPKEYQRKATELLWKTGLMAKVKIATFDLVFSGL